MIYKLIELSHLSCNLYLALSSEGYSLLLSRRHGLRANLVPSWCICLLFVVTIRASSVYQLVSKRTSWLVGEFLTYANFFGAHCLDLSIMSLHCLLYVHCILAIIIDYVVLGYYCLFNINFNLALFLHKISTHSIQIERCAKTSRTQAVTTTRGLVLSRPPKNSINSYYEMIDNTNSCVTSHPQLP